MFEEFMGTMPVSERQKFDIDALATYLRGKVDGFGVAVANSALPLDHPREQCLAGCHQLVHASPQLRGCLFAGGDALPGRSHFPSQAHQLLRVALTFRLEEMSL